MGSTTSKHSLYKPDVGETGWGSNVSATIETIDKYPYFKKGSDVASAATLFGSTYPTDGNYFDVTGTVGITAILTSGYVGTAICLQFDAALTITHSANLYLPGAMNIVTSPGDELIFVEVSSGAWRCIGGNLLMRSSGVRLLSITNVSFAADADTTLYTVPTGKRCVLTHAIVVVDASAGGTTTLSIGQNGAETDFVPANTMSNLSAQYDAAIIQPIPNTTPLLIKSYAAATVIEAQVAANSGGATNTVYLYGILY